MGGPVDSAATSGDAARKKIDTFAPAHWAQL